MFCVQNCLLLLCVDMFGEVFEQLILECVQVQSVKESGICVFDVDVDCVVESVVQCNNLFVLQFKSKLKDVGMMYDKYCDDLCQEILLVCLCECEVDFKVQVYDGEIDNYLVQQGGGMVLVGEQ